MPLSVVPALPFLGFVILLLLGSHLSRTGVFVVGVGGIALSCVAMLLVGGQYFLSTPDFHAYREIAWTWIPFYSSKLDSATIQFAFYLDSLSMLMIGVITFVGTLIALFSVKYLDHDQGIARFFSAMNLFVAAMLVLVLADNFLVLFMGWEGVGLCSYLLIGFWYEDESTGRASIKAFITTRIGDVFLLFALLLMLREFGTLNIQEVLELANAQWAFGAHMATCVALCLLAGAVGKSAQIPLHTWLPDAMKGPTPVSALIHAATMVTAGVYLIARSGGIFALSEAAQMAVLIIGATTLLVAGLSAMVQRDLKKVLAYSTISQLGYMFLSLGVGAYTAAMFHLMVHAFFKALLFLAAGAIGYSMHHNHDLYKMGYLRRKLPGVFWVFLIGSACLAALPLVTAGFFSKEFILAQVYSSPLGGLWPWLIGVAGAFITWLYAFRMVFMVFFGISKGSVSQYPDKKMYIPLFILAGLSLLAGFVQIPAVFFQVSLFSDFVGSSVLPSLSMEESTRSQWILLVSASVVSLCGIFLSYILYCRWKIHEKNPKESSSYLHRFLLSGFAFDALYDFVLIRPFLGISHFLRRDVVQVFCRWVGQGTVLVYELLSMTQTGYVRLYAFAVVFAALVIVLIMVFS